MHSFGTEIDAQACNVSYRNTFRVKPRAILGLIFFTALIQKSEEEGKVLSGCLKNWPLGTPLGHQTSGIH